MYVALAKTHLVLRAVKAILYQDDAVHLAVSPPPPYLPFRLVLSLFQPRTHGCAPRLCGDMEICLKSPTSRICAHLLIGLTSVVFWLGVTRAGWGPGWGVAEIQ